LFFFCSCVLDKKIKNENNLFFCFFENKKNKLFSFFFGFSWQKTDFITRKKRIFCQEKTNNFIFIFEKKIFIFKLFYFFLLK